MVNICDLLHKTLYPFAAQGMLTSLPTLCFFRSGSLDGYTHVPPRRWCFADSAGVSPTAKMSVFLKEGRFTDAHTFLLVLLVCIACFL